MVEVHELLKYAVILYLVDLTFCPLKMVVLLMVMVKERINVLAWVQDFVDHILIFLVPQLIIIILFRFLKNMTIRKNISTIGEKTFSPVEFNGNIGHDNSRLGVFD